MAPAWEFAPRSLAEVAQWLASAGHKVSLLTNRYEVCPCTVPQNRGIIEGFGAGVRRDTHSF